MIFILVQAITIFFIRLKIKNSIGVDLLEFWSRLQEEHQIELMPGNLSQFWNSIELNYSVGFNYKLYLIAVNVVTIIIALIGAIKNSEDKMKSGMMIFIINCIILTLSKLYEPISSALHAYNWKIMILFYALMMIIEFVIIILSIINRSLSLSSIYIGEISAVIISNILGFIISIIVGIVAYFGIVVSGIAIAFLALITFLLSRTSDFKNFGTSNIHIDNDKLYAELNKKEKKTQKSFLDSMIDFKEKSAAASGTLVTDNMSNFIVDEYELVDTVTGERRKIEKYSDGYVTDEQGRTYRHKNYWEFN